MNIEEFKARLKGYKREDIIVTEHADLRADFRKIDLEEVKNNIVNPERLVFIKEVKSKFLNERKFECYFAYSENFCHKYVLTINRKVIIVTIIIINRKWQKFIKK